MTAGASLWVITPYFNPMRWRRRRENYRVFRRRLAAPLLTVELGRDGEYDLAESDADALVRIPNGATLWQKERLIIVGVRHLPAACTHVAWIDCDIVFERDDWPGRTIELLANTALVQLFDEVRHMPPESVDAGQIQPVAILRQPSTVSVITHPADAAARLAHTIERAPGTTANGFAWAARRSLLERFALYDRSILGGGDTAILAAAFNCPDAAMDRHAMNPAQRDAYSSWADPFARAVNSSVAHLPGRISHLWHGDLGDRHASARHITLARLGFDPRRDISINAHGAWNWSTDFPALHNHARDYLASRREDG